MFQTGIPTNSPNQLRHRYSSCSLRRNPKRSISKTIKPDGDVPRDLRDSNLRHQGIPFNVQISLNKNRMWEKIDTAQDAIVKEEYLLEHSHMKGHDVIVSSCRRPIVSGKCERKCIKDENYSKDASTVEYVVKTEEECLKHRNHEKRHKLKKFDSVPKGKEEGGAEPEIEFEHAEEFEQGRRAPFILKDFIV